MKTGSKLHKIEKSTDIFSERIKALRKGRKYTQSFVADFVGVTVRTYVDWEHGRVKSKIDIESLQKLAELFNVSCDYLIGNSDDYIYGCDYISSVTGLSPAAVYALSILHSQHKGVLDFQQASRFDILALNIILEEFLEEYKKASEAGKFSDSTNTPLNCIGQYIDGDSGNIFFEKDGNTELFPKDQFVRTIAETHLHDLLVYLAGKYSLKIKLLKDENKKHFDEIYKKDVPEND